MVTERTVVDGTNGRLVKRGDFTSWKVALEQAQEQETREVWAEAGLARIEGIRTDTGTSRPKAG